MGEGVSRVFRAGRMHHSLTQHGTAVISPALIPLIPLTHLGGAGAKE